MGRSLNKAQIIGHLGKDPEVKTFANGGSVVTFSVATSDQWKDKNTGERREKTEWHRVAIFSEPVGRVAQQYLRKGDQVLIEGRMETRKWTDQQGQDRYTTEVVVRPYQGEMILLGGGRRDSQERSSQAPARSMPQREPAYSDRQPYSPERDMPNDHGYPDHGGYSRRPARYPDDEIPF